jgi:hypothetical protein
VPDITISIGAQDNASAVFRKVAAELDKMGPASKKTKESLTGMEAAAKSLKGEFESLANRLGPVGAAMKAMGPAGTAAAIGIAAMAAAGMGLIRLTGQVAKLGDELDEMAYATGVSVENLSTLKYGAEISGSSLQGLRVALKTMSVNAFDAFQAMKKGGDTLNADAQIWEQLGITITDTNGQLKPAYTLFLQAADALSKLSSETERAAIAQKLFGRSGTEILPMFAKGAQGVQDYQEQARLLNGEMSTEMAARSAKYQDTIAQLGVAFGGLGRAIAEETIGPLTTLVGLLTTITTLGGGVAKGIFSTPGKELAKFQRLWTRAAEPPQAPMFGTSKDIKFPRSDQEIEAMARALLGADVSNEQAEKDAERERQLLELQRQMRDDEQRALTTARIRQMGSAAGLGAARFGRLGDQGSRPEVFAQGAISWTDLLTKKQEKEIGPPLKHVREYNVELGKTGLQFTQLSVGLRSVGLANHAKIALPAWRELAYRIKDWFTGDGGVLSSLRLGLRDYEESLGSLASRVRSSVVAGMQTYRAGLQDAVGGFLFGEEDRKGIPDAKRRLEEIAKMVAALDLGVIAAGGPQAEATMNMLDLMFGQALGEKIPEEYRDKIRDLQIKVAQIFASPTAANKGSAFAGLADLVGEIDEEGGILDRFKRLGENVVDAMKEGMQTTITGSITAALETGIAGATTAILGGVLGGLAKGLGFETGKKVQEGLTESGIEVPAPKRSAFLNAMSDVGTWTETGVAAVVGTLKTIGEYPVKGPNWTGPGGVFDTIADMGGMVYDAINGGVTASGKAFGGILGEFGKLAADIHLPTPDWEGARNTFTAIAGKAKDTVSAIGGLLADIQIPTPTWEGARNTFTAIAGKAQSTVSSIAGLLRGIDLPAPSWDSASGVFDSIKNKAGDVVSVLGHLGDTISLPDLSGLASTLGSAFDAAGDIGKGIKTGISSALTAAFLGAQIGEMFGPNGEIGGAIGAGLGQVISANLGPLGKTVGSLIGTVFGTGLGLLVESMGTESKAKSRADALSGIRSAITTGDIAAFSKREDLLRAMGEYNPASFNLLGQQTQEEAYIADQGRVALTMQAVAQQFGISLEDAGRLLSLLVADTKSIAEMAYFNDLLGTSQWTAIWSSGQTPQYASGISRVPGSEGQAFPAILHGGERVLTAEENRSYGAMTFAPVFNISARSAADGAAIVDAIRRDALPLLERELDRMIRRGSRFGSLEMDQRTLRSGL